MRRLKIVSLSRFSRTWSPVLFVLPALFFYVLFVAYPVLGTINYSMHEWDGASPVMSFVGFGNFIELFQDNIFWRALSNNAIWIITTIVAPVFLGLFLAVLLSTDKLKGLTIFRVSFFLPAVLSLVVVSVVWTWIYHPEYGKVNVYLNAFGLHSLTQAWLGNPKTVLGSLLVAGSWTYYGFCMVIFLAALQTIDQTYYDAAKIEGANPAQTFFKVTVPMLKNTVTLLILNSMIGSFKVFDIIYVTTKGGPFHSSEVVSTYMYNKAFYQNEVGYGAAIAIMLAVLISVFSGLYLKSAERE